MTAEPPAPVARRHPRRRLGPWRSQDGFTLIELLVAMSVGLLVLFAAFGLMDSSATLAARTQGRIDATQRGRLAMEQITRLLRSQVCLGPAIPPIVNGQDSSATFYANLGTVDAVPDKYVLRLVGGTIYEDVYTGSGTPPNMTFVFQRTVPVLEHVEALPGTPLFQYWAFDDSDPVQADQLLSTPLSTGDGGDAARTVEVSIAFLVRPDPRLGQPAASATLRDSTYVRIADPTDPSHGPQCA